MSTEAAGSAKTHIMQQLTKYIKLKQTDLDVEANDIMDNLKECKLYFLNALVLTYLEKKNIININQLEQD